MIKVLPLIATLSIASCSGPLVEKDVLGAYVAQDYVNSIDTIYVKHGGIYERRVYASDRSPVLRMHGRWTLNAVGNRQISFYSFFLNLDRDLLKYPELIADTTLRLSRVLESRSGSLGFCAGYYDGKNCYRRVED